MLNIDSTIKRENTNLTFEFQWEIMLYFNWHFHMYVTEELNTIAIDHFQKILVELDLVEEPSYFLKILGKEELIKVINLIPTRRLRVVFFDRDIYIFRIR